MLKASSCVNVTFSRPYVLHNGSGMRQPYSARDKILSIRVVFFLSNKGDGGSPRPTISNDKLPNVQLLRIKSRVFWTNFQLEFLIAMSSEFTFGDDSDDFTIFRFFYEFGWPWPDRVSDHSETDAVMTARTPGADKGYETGHTYTTNCADRQRESDCFITFGANKKTLHSMLWESMAGNCVAEKHAQSMLQLLNLWGSGRRSGCPHSLVQRSSAGCLPCTSCWGAQWTARGGRGRRWQTGGRGRSKGRSRIKESAPCWWPWMEIWKCSGLEPWSVRVSSQLWTIRASSVHVVVRHASVEVQVHCVNVVIGVFVVVHFELLVVVRVVPVLLVML